LGIPRRIHSLLAGATVGLATASLMLATEPALGIVFDEGYTLGREARLRAWFQAMRNPARFASQWRPPRLHEELVQMDGMQRPGPEQLRSRWALLFDRQPLWWFWPFAGEEPHGHPPFYALLGLVGDVLAPTSWRALPRARLGPILLFSFTAGAIFQFVAARWGNWPAALAAASWVFQPNLFGLGHYAHYDAPLSALWILAILAFDRAVAPGSEAQPLRVRRGWTAAFGLILGCAAATKFTGWFLPLPFLAWVGLYRSRQAFKTLLIGLIVAAAVVLLLIPPWWTDPIAGVVRFFRSNLGRGGSIPITVQFLHKVYNTPREALPWYNTLAWTVLVTPVGFLVLGLVGFATALRRWRVEPFGLLIAGHWAFLMILRALPHTPGHDGVRLFLPAFGVLALLGGLGARALLDRWGRWARAAIVAAIIEGIASVAVMMPVPLSYFSPLVGGLPGAAALGMEPTYYWDALTPDVRLWLARNTQPGRTFLFATNPSSWRYLRQTGELPSRLFPADPGDPQWFVLQNRPGAFAEVHRTLIASVPAAYTVSKLGVPLVWIFPYRELERLLLRRPRAQSHRSERAAPRWAKKVRPDDPREATGSQGSRPTAASGVARGGDRGFGYRRWAEAWGEVMYGPAGAAPA
jgi:4-amino-4-deoxy-L-arabinose transferase-like glycosyltransferase